MKIYNFDDIYEDYDLFFIDIWGVVHDGITPYPGTINRLNKLLKEKDLSFLSNAPRPNIVVSKKLNEFGLNISSEQVITSGDLKREYLKKIIQQEKTIYHLGEDRNQDILAGLNVKTSHDIKHADYLLLSLYLDEHEDLNQFDELFCEAINKGIPILCANPDTTVRSNSYMRYCAGYFAEKIEEMGGKVEYFGKPHKNIYDFARIKMTKNIADDKILMIGDTIDKDIVGARNAGIHSTLVLTGNTSALLRDHEANDISTQLKVLDQQFEIHQAKPNWIINGMF
jgi:HAD superfamily hydrolase (TIGR01459 family)